MARPHKERQPAGPVPSGHHDFVEPEDPRLGLAISTVKGWAQPPMMMVADYSLREPHCRVCQKVESDPVHLPPD